MRIRIDFAEAVKYTFSANWFYQRSNDLMNDTANELVNIIQGDYFNGADKAVIYLGYSLDNEYFEFELIPNI